MRSDVARVQGVKRMKSPALLEDKCQDGYALAALVSQVSSGAVLKD